MVKIMFFASLREHLNQAEVRLERFEGSAGDLLERLVQLNPDWELWLQSGALLCAVNQEFSDLNSRVKSGDEVAFFPPVTGG